MNSERYEMITGNESTISDLVMSFLCEWDWEGRDIFTDCFFPQFWRNAPDFESHVFSPRHEKLSGQSEQIRKYLNSF